MSAIRRSPPPRECKLYGIFDPSQDIRKNQIKTKGYMREVDSEKKEIVLAKYLTTFLQKKKHTRDDLGIASTGYKILRFLVKVDGTLVFAKEGYPYKEIPAHFQMTNLDWEKASCLAAGNAYFDNKNFLRKINHKSGDFKPPFHSLAVALPIFKKNKVKFSSRVEIEELNRKGGPIKTYLIDSSIINQDDPNKNKVFIHLPSPRKLNPKHKSALIRIGFITSKQAASDKLGQIDRVPIKSRSK